MRKAPLKKLLDGLVAEYRGMERTGDDPVWCLRSLAREEDIECAAFVAAPLAYGRVASIRNSTARVLAALTDRPYEFVRDFDPRRDSRRLEGFVHRFTTREDMIQFLTLTSRLVRKHGRLKTAFLSVHDRNTPLGETMSRFAAEFRAGATRPRPHLRYMLPDPADGSACKRFNLFLRWMARPADGVDFGLWPEIGPERLVIPLDVHVARISRALGLLARKSDDWLAAEDVTASLRELSPEDPVRYDFAIAHLGITGRWRELVGGEAHGHRTCGAKTVPPDERAR